MIEESREVSERISVYWGEIICGLKELTELYINSKVNTTKLALLTLPLQKFVTDILKMPKK